MTTIWITTTSTYPQPIPHRSMICPATSGPTTPATDTPPKFAAVAFRRFGLPAISTVRAIDAGICNPEMSPPTAANVMICQICTASASTTAASKISPAVEVVVPRMRIRRRETRSARTPPGILIIAAPPPAAAATTPTMNAESVICSVSHPCTIISMKPLMPLAEKPSQSRRN